MVEPRTKNSLCKLCCIWTVWVILLWVVCVFSPKSGWLKFFNIHLLVFLSLLDFFLATLTYSQILTIHLQTTVILLPIETMAKATKHVNQTFKVDSRSPSLSYCTNSFNQVFYTNGWHRSESKESPTEPKRVYFNEVDYKSSSNTLSQGARHPRLLSSRQFTG